MANRNTYTENTEQSLRLVTFETFILRETETRPDQRKENGKDKDNKNYNNNDKHNPSDM
jgi:hypothetical protein